MTKVQPTQEANTNQEQQLFLKDIFNHISAGNYRIAVSYIQNGDFDVTTQDTNTGDNILHHAAKAGEDAVDAVCKALKNRFLNTASENVKDANKDTKTLTHKETLTTGEVALLTGVSQQTIIRNCDRGLLQHHKVPGSKFRRIKRADLIKFMKEHNIPMDAFNSDSHTGIWNTLINSRNHNSSTPRDLGCEPQISAYTAEID